MNSFLKKGGGKLIVTTALFCLIVLISRKAIQRLAPSFNNAGHQELLDDEGVFARNALAYYRAPYNPYYTKDFWQNRSIELPPKINEPPAPIPAPEKSKEKATYVAIVVDDLGINFRLAKELMEIKLDLTFALLPKEDYTDKIAKAANAKGIELMLHMPMEPYEETGKSPGKEALWLSMSNEEIKNKVDDMLALVPTARGVNNHMGSKFCEDSEKMSLVMNALKERGLYFLDSKTSEKSSGRKTAQMSGTPNIGRDIFLDNNKEEAEIIKQLDRLIKMSKKQGYVVAICHPYSETIATLKKTLHIFQENNVKVRRLSEVINIANMQKSAPLKTVAFKPIKRQSAQFKSIALNGAIITR